MKIKHRNLLTKLIPALIACLCSLSAWADFATVDVSTQTAGVTLTGEGQMDISVELKNVDITTGELGGTTAQIHWDNLTLPLQSQWKIANTAIVLHSTITINGGGIQIFTDNAGTDANPKYTGAGLNALGAMLDTADVSDVDDGESVDGNVTEAEQNASRITLCWRVVDTSTNTLNIQQGKDGSGNDILFDPAISSAFGQFFFMLDKARMNDPGAPATDKNGADFVTVKDNRGVHFFPGPADFGFMPSPEVIYIGGNFDRASPGRTYNTKIKLEAFRE